MIRISETARRNTGEPLLPMIDVVFFLVVFFMLTSRLSDPEPFLVVPPQATSQAIEGEFSIYLDATGHLATIAADRSEAEALATLSAQRSEVCSKFDCAKTPPVLLLHADMMAPAQRVTKLIADLHNLGFPNVRLVTTKP